MTKQLLLFLFISFVFTVPTVAQNCVPDTTLKDSTGFVYPPPYHEEFSPEGGIDAAACINEPYEFVWQVITPPTVEILGLSLNLSYLKLNTEGAIKNLPLGINYLCNPPDCQFNVGEVGCVLLYGSATADNPAGNYSLEFEGTLRLAVGANFPVTFPDPGIFPGEYILELFPEGSPECQPLSVDPEVASLYHHQFYPNPVVDQAWLQLFSPSETMVMMDIFDLSGKLFRSSILSLHQGENTVPVDIKGLGSGYWMYRLTWPDGRGTSAAFIKNSR